MIQYADVSWERMIRAVEKVRERTIRTARTLDAAGIPYAIVGGNAVAAWVARVDEAAVRNTQDVDVLLRRSDLPGATAAMQAAGFIYDNVNGVDLFLDGPDATPRHAVHVVFAGEKVFPADAVQTPDVSESEVTPTFRLVSLLPLVRMKLTAFRRKDQVHIEDMLAVGLIDENTCASLPPVLADRLRHLIATPNG